MANPFCDLGFVTLLYPAPDANFQASPTVQSAPSTSIQSDTEGALIPVPAGPPPPDVRVCAGRCSEKGCVFPAIAPDGGRCHQHDLECREPDLFGSQQPSMLLLDRAKFGLPDSEAQARESRLNDRRRLARQRERFLEGVA